MSEPSSDSQSSGVSAAQHPRDNPNMIITGSKSCITLLNKGNADVILRAPLPGIVIFVHGVNSDGEWYKAAEKGLCAGLNERLKRCDEHMAYPTPEGGQLTPATYIPELTPDGYINPDMDHKTFITSEEQFTPVIHFRWGYKANSLELQKFGDGIYLNEKNYWGGGPFANGCTSLPDMWGVGLSENLLLWMHVEHLNPVNDRSVYACPPKPYFVLAALRLARLVEAIRMKQADVPITIVCHSQGNMIGMAAAFFGDAMAPARDAAGIAGRCVADTYVLCNPPYSLTNSNHTEDWSYSEMKDKHGGRGRQTRAARIGTLRAFFDIIRQPAAPQQKSEDINQAMANRNHGFDAASDRKKYGNETSTCGRVTLYCNPHDQVISSLAVQGIGWRGMSKIEIDDTHGEGVFTQRVFAQGYPVGKKGPYHYWQQHYRQPKPGSPDFWMPLSPRVEYSIGKGLDASRGNVITMIFTLVMAPIAIIAVKFSNLRINALPHVEWEIPINAPELLPMFEPKAVTFGGAECNFDQAYVARGQSRNVQRERSKDDAYAGDRPIPKGEGDETGDATDAAKGNEESEAAMRYDDHARLRMQARREGWAKKTDEHVPGEDQPETASTEYKAWSKEKIQAYLAANVNTHATDHSTIMTNAEHARKALAYDVAIGYCHIRDKDMHAFRIAADWRFGEGLDGAGQRKFFKEYFDSGNLNEASLYKWAKDSDSPGRMPNKIVDEREHQPQPAWQQTRTNQGGHQ